MNELSKLGQRRTILLSISVLLVSVYTILLYHFGRPELENKKVIQQVVRFTLTVGLLVMVYKGKKWAKIISIVLFALGFLTALVGFLTLQTPLINKIPILVMMFVYVMSIYHFGFAHSFKAFNKYQNSKAENDEVKQDFKALMESDKFWEIIEVSKSKSLGDYEKQQTELENELLKLTAIEVLEFKNMFRTLRGEINNWDFWAAAYIINRGCSDDCFSDFRGWLIGQGKTTFENAIQNVESLAELDNTNDGDWEGLSYIPTVVYEKKTGVKIPQGIHENIEISGEEWEEDENELKNRFPKLYSKFGVG